MTDVGLAAIARGCPNLRHLSASGCVRLADASMRVLAALAGGGLRVLDVSGCRRVRGKEAPYVKEGGHVVPLLRGLMLAIGSTVAPF